MDGAKLRSRTGNGVRAGNGEPPQSLPPAGNGTDRAAGDPLHPADPGELPVLHVLVVDDDAAVRNACAEAIRRRAFAVDTAASLAEAREILRDRKLDLLLLDLKLSSHSGLILVEEVKRLHPEMQVLVMTAFATVNSAVEAMRIGASDYLTKPFALEELLTVVERAAEQIHFDLESRRLRERMRNPRGSGLLIGRTPEMEKLYRILSKVAFTQHPVLILGETGTGKELVARSIHYNGPHAQKPFVPVDCGSLVPDLIEGELFGYVRGASLGGRAPAHQSKDGLLTTADGGTVFLDEIGELPLELQARLLRALQERSVTPVGGTHSIPISARVLAATNRDLAAMVEAGRFRKDLYFRLNVVNLRIPPLRARRDDIPLLVQHFLERAQRESGVAHTLSDEALRAVVQYNWPGNVRELETAIERACALSSGPILHLRDLPTQIHDSALHERYGKSGAQAGLAADAEVPETPRIVSIAELERNAILGTLRELKGDKLMAAKLLGIGKTTLYRKLKEYGVSDGLDDES